VLDAATMTAGADGSGRLHVTNIGDAALELTSPFHAARAVRSRRVLVRDRRVEAVVFGRWMTVV
jgi:hypothetical protein